MESERRPLIGLKTDLLERAGRLRLESGDAAGALEYAEAAAALDAPKERPFSWQWRQSRRWGVVKLS